MLHEPAAKSGRDPSSPYKTRLGVRMFLLYTLIYAGFIAVNVISPLSMEKEILLGLNLAVVYGFGLIVFALLLALVYDRLCHNREVAMAGPEGEAK